jgi:hypothetical protein
MQHALQGWCPLLPLLRSVGFRTQYEIERERCALLAISGRANKEIRQADEVKAGFDRKYTLGINVTGHQRNQTNFKKSKRDE